jgi:DNA-binding response OmpR family regulator
MAGTILLADSSAVIHKTAKQVLINEGIEVVSTGNGELAIALLDAIRPDLVMVEASLPGTSGYALCEQIKHEPRFAHVPVVLLAWTSEVVNQTEAHRVGVDAILSKPFESRKLVAITRRLLKQRKEALNARAVVIPFPVTRRAAPKLAEPNSAAEAGGRHDEAMPVAENASDDEMQFIELLAALKESRVSDAVERADARQPSVSKEPESNAANETLPRPDDSEETPKDKPSDEAALATISQHDRARPAPSHRHWQRAAMAALALATIGVAGPVLMQSSGAPQSPPMSSTASMSARQNPLSLPTDEAGNARDAGKPPETSITDFEAAKEPPATIAQSPTTLAPPTIDAPPATADDEPPAVDSSVKPPALKRSSRRTPQSETAERNLNPYARNLRLFRAIRLNAAATTGNASASPSKAAMASPATPITRTKPSLANTTLPAGADAKAPPAPMRAPARATRPPSASQAAAPEYTNGFAEIGKGVKSAAGKVGQGFKAFGKGLKKVFKPSPR